MDRALKEMGAAGERYRAKQAAKPPAPRPTMAQIFEALNFRVVSLATASAADPAAHNAAVARLGITEQLHDRLLAAQAARIEIRRP
jgi:hypothetical protein